jgi:hypothetical protein
MDGMLEPQGRENRQTNIYGNLNLIHDVIHPSSNDLRVELSDVIMENKTRPLFAESRILMALQLSVICIHRLLFQMHICHCDKQEVNLAADSLCISKTITLAV